MPPPRSTAGQASAEYVALLAVVCAIVAGAAVVGSPPPLALKVAAAVRHGICLVGGGICTPTEARAAGLAPCLLQARMDRERLGGRLLLVRLGRGDALLVERRSDGSAAVSFTDAGSAGGTVGVGLQVPGSTRLGVRGGAGVQFTAGRTWEFARFAEAAAFVRRWTPRESLGGEAKRVLRDTCPFCHHHPSRRMPAADATFQEGGHTASSPPRCAAGPAAAGWAPKRRVRPGRSSDGAWPAAAASRGTTASTSRPRGGSARYWAPFKRALRGR